MAYQNVGTPRFYIDNISWLRSLGIGSVGDGDPDIFGFNVANPSVLQPDTWTSGDNYEIDYVYGTDYIPMSYNFCAILGHNFKTTDAEWGSLVFYTRVDGEDGDSTGNLTGGTHTEIANQGFGYDGYSIIEFADTLSAPHNSVYFHVDAYNGGAITIGRFLAGKIYEMPHASDLSLSLSYSTGTKTIETRGGASLSNTMWRPPMWGDNLAAWELSDPTYPNPAQVLARNSRKSWKLSFSFLAKDDTFPKYNSLNTIGTDDMPDDYTGEDADSLPHTLLQSDDFFSRVWNVVGTHSKFIFQPDKDVAEFAICKFTKPISFQQTAPGLYRISNLEIREVW